MLVYKLLSVALAFLLSALRVSCSYEECACTKPKVRREWRAFSRDEKAEWIRAINVRIDTPHIDHLADVDLEYPVLVTAAS
jgi:hypothetical protein